jgi:hypothetical protein
MKQSNVNFQEKNKLTIEKLSIGARTQRDERDKSTDADLTQIKLVNRKRVKQYFIEEFNDILNEIYQSRTENFSTQELNFGGNNCQIEYGKINQILTYSEYKSILIKLKLISGSEFNKDEKYLTIQL